MSYGSVVSVVRGILDICISIIFQLPSNPIYRIQVSKLNTEDAVHRRLHLKRCVYIYIYLYWHSLVQFAIIIT